MSKDLDALLDNCIDRMNRGQSLEDCLADYPEHAEELRPLLECLGNVNQTYSSIPRAEARSKARQRLNAAVLDYSAGLQETRHRRMSLFGLPLAWAAASAVVVALLVGIGLYGLLAKEGAPAPNFRLLVSDEVNAIGDFRSTEVTINSIRVLPAGSGNEWKEIKLSPSVVIDLTRLQGLNAKAIWGGVLPEGQYIKACLHVENATGILMNGSTVDIKFAGDCLEISKPFAIKDGKPPVNFVYDVTVAATTTDNGTVEYTLVPQENEGGAGRTFHEIGDGELSIQVVQGNIAVGENITALVSFENAPVSGALVTVNEKKVGTTNLEGRVSFTVPDDDELEIEAVSGDREGELEIDLDEDCDDENELAIRVEGGISPGSSVTVHVTLEGEPVPSAVVMVGKIEVGATDQDGQMSLVLPNNIDDEVEIKAVQGAMEGSIEIDLDEGAHSGKHRYKDNGQHPDD